jgi:putative ABC transport system permease protein
VRTAFATVWSPPWRRAPWLLWRRAGMVAMVVGAGLVLVAPVAAVPLFLSSAGTASVEVQADERCARDTGVSYTAALPIAEAATTGEAAGTAEAAPGADDPASAPPPLAPLAGEVGPVTSWARSEVVELAGPDPADDTQAVVLSRDGATDRIELLDGELGPGALIADRAVDLTGLRPGDTATVDGVPIPIAGVYRDLAGISVAEEWCSHGDLLLPRADGIERTLPPPVVLVDRPTYAGLMADLGAERAGVTWEAPLRDGLTVADTDRLIDDLACVTPRAGDLAWCADGRPDPTLGRPTGVGRTGEVAGTDVPRSSTDDDYDREAQRQFVARFFETSLPFVVDRAGSIRTSVGGGVWPVAGCAALAGVGFVAAAGSLWFDRRRRELTLLTVRGVSPAGLGLKAVLELAFPLAAGAVGGVALAYGLVRWLGPSSLVEPPAVTRAVASGAAGLAVAMLVVGLVVARRVRTGHATTGRGPAWLRVVPWEVALVAASVVSYRRLGEWGVPVSHGARVSRVDPLGLLFPVLFLLAAVAVAARLLVLGIGPLRSASRGWPTPLYLAVRRVSRYRVAVVGLVASSAVAAGVLGYAATLNRSLDATLDTKARVFVGSDVAVRLGDGPGVPDSLAGRATTVDAYTRAWVDADLRQGDRRGEEEVTVIAIDPATFEQATFWDSTFSGTGFGEILDRLAEAPAEPVTEDGGGPIPAVVTGLDSLPDTAGVVIRGSRTSRFAIERVADVRAFPGMKRPMPTVFVAAEHLAPFELSGARTETWIKGDRDRTLAALRDAGTGFAELRQATEVVDRAAFLTVAWTFDFMQAIALAAGLLVLGGLAAYLDARRRNRLLGYAFARRMGLTPAQHRRALLAELVASVVVGCWLGLGIALAGAWLAHGRLDPVPGFRPGPVLRPASAVVLALAVTAGVVAVVAAAVVQRRTDRDDPVEVLRAGA